MTMSIVKKPLNIISAYADKIAVLMSFSENSPHTKQSFKDECDINTLMRRYQSTGEIPQMDTRTPQFLDATGYDYQQHMTFIAEANSLFQDLPSAIRNQFANDPAKFLDFTADDRNRVKMAEMGLLSTEATKAILYPPDPIKIEPAAVQAEITKT
ncbi:MAG: internal scaffolding protein [Microviridae sp.]|nr:MAG: internal scaffolding protein [Microviridae sp.]